MDTEQMKKTNDMLDDALLIKKTKESYISKEAIIDLISSLDFTEVSYFNIECITGYRIKLDSKGEKYVSPYSFEIDIH